MYLSPTTIPHKIKFLHLLDMKSIVSSSVVNLTISKPEMKLYSLHSEILTSS